MAHPISHFLSDHFPESIIRLTRRRSKGGFMAVTTALAGLLIGSIALVLFILA